MENHEIIVAVEARWNNRIGVWEWMPIAFNKATSAFTDIMATAHPDKEVARAVALHYINKPKGEPISPRPLAQREA